MKRLADFIDHQLDPSPEFRPVGIQLSPHEKALILGKLELLKERAPSLTTTRLSIFKEKNGIKASLVINGAGLNFRAMETAKTALDAFDTAEAKIDRQLTDWKKNRFKNSYGVYCNKSVFTSGGHSL